jgi:hypothetical protein
MKRAELVGNAVALVKARRHALNLPVSNAPTKVTDSTMYLVYRVDGKSSINKLTNGDTKKKIGVTNFDGNRLRDGRDAVVDAIKITVAKDGLVESNVDWFNNKWTAPAELANAELRLIQKDKTLLDFPVSDLLLSNDNDNYREIGNFPFLQGKEDITWELEFADGQIIPAEAVNGLFIKIELRVIQAIQ